MISSLKKNGNITSLKFNSQYNSDNGFNQKSPDAVTPKDKNKNIIIVSGWKTEKQSNIPKRNSRIPEEYLTDKPTIQVSGRLVYLDAIRFPDF